ncbi:MAG: hypothetical protein Aurels2KO_00390 [Aureliella sp.]
MIYYKPSLDYLRARLTIESVFWFLLAVVVCVAYGAIGVFGGLVGIGVSSAWFWARKRDVFYIQDGMLRTRRLLTDLSDSSVPIDQITSVSVHMGLLEAQFSVGTVQMTTSAEDAQQARVLWAHVPQPEEIAAIVRKAMVDERRSDSEMPG